MATTYTTPITFTGIEAMDYIKESPYRTPLFDAIHTITQGIIVDQQIAWGNLWDDQLFKLNSGCGSGYVNKDVDLTAKTWSPKEIKAWTQTCWATFESSLFAYTLKNGADIADIDNTLLGTYIVENMTQGIWRQIFNLAWFGDTNAALVTDSPAGYYTAGTTLAYHNILDGFFEQLFDGVTAGTVERYTITYNAGVSYAVQLALAAGYARTVFMEMYNLADERLLTEPDTQYLITRSLWQNWVDYRTSQTGLESSFKNMETGILQSDFYGVPIIPILEWDRYIRTFLDNTVTYHLPHRAVLTTKSNLNIGMDAASSPDAWKAWLDDTTELYNIKSMFKMDVKLFREELAVIAY